MHTATAVLLTVLLTHHISYLHSKTIYVSPYGNDTSNGFSSLTPVLTVKKALELANSCGDLVELANGTYYEYGLSPSPGLSTCFTAPGFVLRAASLGGATISAYWKPAATGNLSWTDEQNYFSARLPQNTTFGNFGIFQVTGQPNGTLLLYHNNPADLSSTDFTSPAAAGTLKKADYGFTFNSTHIMVRLPGNENPNGKFIKFPRPNYLNANGPTSILSINVANIIIEGIVVEGTWDSCIISTQNNATLRNMVFSNCKVGAQLGDASSITWSDFTIPFAKEYFQQLAELNNGQVNYYPIARYQNIAGAEWMSMCITSLVRASRGVTISYNRMTYVPVGIETGGFQNSTISNNVVISPYLRAFSFGDVALTTSGGYNKIHHNLILGAQGAILQQFYGQVFPSYFYRNIIYGYDNLGFASFAFLHVEFDGNTNIGVYNNLIWGCLNCNILLYHEPLSNSTLIPKIEFKNNVVICNSDYSDTSNVTSKIMKANANYNYVFVDAISSNIAGPNGYTDLYTSISVLGYDTSTISFGITPSSPLINAGVSIPGFDDPADSGNPDVGPFSIQNNQNNQVSNVQTNYNNNSNNNYNNTYSVGNLWPRDNSVAYTTALVFPIVCLGNPGILFYCDSATKTWKSVSLTTLIEEAQRWINSIIFFDGNVVVNEVEIGVVSSNITVSGNFSTTDNSILTLDASDPLLPSNFIVNGCPNISGSIHLNISSPQTWNNITNTNYSLMHFSCDSSSVKYPRIAVIYSPCGNSVDTSISVSGNILITALKLPPLDSVCNGNNNNSNNNNGGLTPNVIYIIIGVVVGVTVIAIIIGAICYCIKAKEEEKMFTLGGGP